MLRGLWIFSAVALLPSIGLSNVIKADNVLVVKSERALYLKKGNKTLKKYRIALGKSPQGHKKKEGDKKTPEGDYMLDWRNPQSQYYKSIHISYPEPHQIKQAQKVGINPGGMIMIHGAPNGYDAPIPSGIDWTDGCIAVSNEAMDEIWLAVNNGTPIRIEP